jgi:hypothetical protein
MRFGDDDGGHQLGERGDRQNGLGVLAEQDFVRVLIHDQGDARLQLERIGGLVQSDQLTERRLGRLGADRDDAAVALAAGTDDEDLAHVGVGGNLGQTAGRGAALRRLGRAHGARLRAGAGAGEEKQGSCGDQGAHWVGSSSESAARVYGTR